MLITLIITLILFAVLILFKLSLVTASFIALIFAQFLYTFIQALKSPSSTGNYDDDDHHDNDSRCDNDSNSSSSDDSSCDSGGGGDD